MKKAIKRVSICMVIAVLIWFGGVIADRQKLNEELIRLHVVANSDSAEDQAIKLRVRDAVVESLQAALADVSDVEAAKAYLRDSLPKIQAVANQVLERAGVEADAVVTLSKEAFDTRHYDTFSLPGGIYESLRIVIGDGEGHNWWCVVFPQLCLPVTASGFEDVAVMAGFRDDLTAALEGQEGYELRFFLLDALGKVENLLHQE